MCNECTMRLLPTGVQFFDSEGRLHCLTGPAVMHTFGLYEYHLHGQLHRDGDLPAIIYPNGVTFYCKNGKKHRDGGKPAVVYPPGVGAMPEYWENGVFIRRGWD